MKAYILFFMTFFVVYVVSISSYAQQPFEQLQNCMVKFDTLQNKLNPCGEGTIRGKIRCVYDTYYFATYTGCITLEGKPHGIGELKYEFPDRIVLMDSNEGKLNGTQTIQEKIGGEYRTIFKQDYDNNEPIGRATIVKYNNEELDYKLIVNFHDQKYFGRGIYSSLTEKETIYYYCDGRQLGREQVWTINDIEIDEQDLFKKEIQSDKSLDFEVKSYSIVENDSFDFTILSNITGEILTEGKQPIQKIEKNICSNNNIVIERYLSTFSLPIDKVLPFGDNLSIILNILPKDNGHFSSLPPVMSFQARIKVNQSNLHLYSVDSQREQNAKNTCAIIKESNRVKNLYRDIEYTEFSNVNIPNLNNIQDNDISIIYFQGDFVFSSNDLLFSKRKQKQNVSSSSQFIPLLSTNGLMEQLSKIPGKKVLILDSQSFFSKNGKLKNPKGKKRQKYIRKYAKPLVNKLKILCGKDIMIITDILSPYNYSPSNDEESILKKAFTNIFTQLDANDLKSTSSKNNILSFMDVGVLLQKEYKKEIVKSKKNIKDNNKYIKGNYEMLGMYPKITTPTEFKEIYLLQF